MTVYTEDNVNVFFCVGSSRTPNVEDAVWFYSDDQREMTELFKDKESEAGVYVWMGELGRYATNSKLKMDWMYIRWSANLVKHQGDLPEYGSGVPEGSTSWSSHYEFRAVRPVGMVHAVDPRIVVRS